MSVTSSGSNNADDAGGLLRRAMSAFDLLAGYHQTLGLAVSGGSDSLSLLVLGAARLVFGMPMQAIKLGAAEDVVSLDGMPRWLVERAAAPVRAAAPAKK